MAAITILAACVLTPRSFGDEMDSSSITECPEGFFTEPPKDAMSPPETPPSACGITGESRYIFRQSGSGKIVPFLVEGPANQIRSSLSYRELKALLASGEPVPEALRMSREELARLVEQLDMVRSGTEKYQDINIALKDGYQAPKTKASGMHYGHRGRRNDHAFNFAEPEYLMYHPHDGHFQLVGIVFFLPVADFGSTHPEGFAGPLDNWHVHYNLCLGTEEQVLEPEECRRLGGKPLHEFGWMIHAWVWEEVTNGVFSFEHPEHFSSTNMLE